MTQKKTAQRLEPHGWTDGGDRVFIMKRIDRATRTTHGGFHWPESGPVECPDWLDNHECGGGLHGWPWGMGLGEGVDYDIIEDEWIVLAARPEDVRGNIDGGWKCKARRGEIIATGSFASVAMIDSGRQRLIEAMASSGARSKLASSGADSICAIAASNGSVSVGPRGAFAIAYWADPDGRRFLCGKAGEGGIEAGVKYRVESGVIVRAE